MAHPLGVCLLVLTALTGCLGPVTENASPPVEELPGQANEPGADRCERTPRWGQDAGRMNLLLRRRHAPPVNAESTLLIDDFSTTSARGIPGWQMLGAPRIKPVQVEGKQGVELMAPDGQEGSCGIERAIPPSLVQGRLARIEMTLLCTSPEHLKALQSVRLAVVVQDAAGRQHEMAMPIDNDLSPEWETVQWALRFDPAVVSASLRLQIDRAGDGILLSRLRAVGRDLRARPRRPSGSTPVAGSADAPINVVTGGDFETGRASFFTSGVGRWPNGDNLPLPIAWDFDGEAVVGERSLRLHATEVGGRVGFGPLPLNPVAMAASEATWHLQFFARAARPVRLAVTLRDAGGTRARHRFDVDSAWRRFTHEFTLDVQDWADWLKLAEGEIVFEFNPVADGSPFDAWLDGVSLCDEPIEADYVPAEAIEVGIDLQRLATGDLRHICIEGETIDVDVRLARSAALMTTLTPARAATRPATATTQPLQGEASLAADPAGTLAIDLVDAWDRSLRSWTLEPRLSPQGHFSMQMRWRLPVGYYRVLATLWSGRPGASTLISQAQAPLAVISVADAVPRANQFGLTAGIDAVSAYTTALGAGWVRLDLASRRIEIEPGVWRFDDWQAGMVRCRKANVDVVAAVTLPAVARFRRSFVQQFLAASPTGPLGLIVSPPALSSQPAHEYLGQLGRLNDLIQVAEGRTRLVCDVFALAGPDVDTALPAEPNLVYGFALAPELVPEHAEPLLQALGRQYASHGRLWDLATPVRLGGTLSPSQGIGLPWRTIGTAGPIQRLETPPDPQVSASRMIRAILIRGLAGAQFVCCDATALSPVQSIHEPMARCLHNPDLTPRPALVAFERMTSLLNSATLRRWMDVPGGSRLLLYDRDDGGAVVAFWRPFGLGVSALALPDVSAAVQQLDCFGVPASPVAQGGERILYANEVLRYLVASPADAGVLRESLPRVHLLSAFASQPAR